MNKQFHYFGTVYFKKSPGEKKRVLSIAYCERLRAKIFI